MATAKSFTDLGRIYEQSVLLNEGNAGPASTEKNTVGKKQDIGEAKLVKEGGDEKVKKDLETPTEGSKAAPQLSEPEKPVSESKEKQPVKTSLFDQIYKQIVSENDDPLKDDASPIDTPPAGEPDGDETPIGGSEEEVVDPVAVVKEICALVTKLKTHFGISDDDSVLEGDPLEGAVPAVGEAVEMKEVPDSAGQKLTKKGNDDTKGTKVVSGKAESKVTAGDGKIEKAPDGAKLAGNKDNKVKGDGAATKGGGASALE